MPRLPTTSDSKHYNRAICQEPDCEWDPGPCPPKPTARSHTAITGHTVCFEHIEQRTFRPKKNNE